MSPQFFLALCSKSTEYQVIDLRWKLNFAHPHSQTHIFVYHKRGNEQINKQTNNRTENKNKSTLCEHTHSMKAQI